MDLASTLAELGERLGIGPIALDDDGGCQLAFDDHLVVDIETADDEPGFHLTAAVCVAPHLGREAVFAELLDANLHGRGTGRCCLALDADLDEIVLTRYIDRDDIDLQTLEAELESFLQMLAVWRTRHSEGELGTLRGGAPDQSPSSIPHQGMLRA